MKRHHHIIILFLLMAFSLPGLLKALEPGEIVPAFTVRKWLHGGAVNPDKIADGQHLMIIFWASWSPLCVESIPLINFFQEKYGKKFKILALTKEKQKVAEKFISEHPEIEFPIGYDTGGSISKRYLGVNLVIPRIFIVNRKKVLVWQGELVDLERVLEKIDSGKFDLRKQRKISAYRKLLQAGIQGRQHDVVIEMAGHILDIAPKDPVSLRSRLFAHEQKGEYDAALKFLENLIKRVPDYPLPYFLKLDMLAARPQNPKVLAEWCKKIHECFPKNAEVQNRLTLTILDGAPFGSAPLDIALASAKDAVKLLTKKDPAVRWAAFYTSLSRVYYAIGIIDKAIEIQDKACALLKGMKEEPAAKRLKDFYNGISKLKNAQEQKP